MDKETYRDPDDVRNFHPRAIKLPCGGTGVPEEYSYRCWTCMAIYGSMGCPCTRDKKDNKVSK